MVQVNIEENMWKEFIKQSIDKRISASKRISEFVEKELKEDEKYVKGERDIGTTL